MKRATGSMDTSLSSPPSLQPSSARRTPQLWIGLFLVALFWTLNWTLEGLRTQWLFFPLWLGYTLVVDGLCARRSGTSALTRSALGFVLQFILSAPGWWLFELINLRIGNWEYVGREHFSDLEYALYCTLSFSTVLPAILGTTELVLTSRFVQRAERGPKLTSSAWLPALCAMIGLAMLAAMLIWPSVFYLFCWTSLVFLFEALSAWLGRGGMSADLKRGDWRLWSALWIAGLACGFLWEMWNFWSYPKWIYHVPGADFWRVFEMPLLGYLGYLPFAMEQYLFAELFLPRISRAELCAAQAKR